MPPVKLEFPPGLFRVGTEYQSEGRFWDANLWRWHMGKSGPVGGWDMLAELRNVRVTETSAVRITEDGDRRIAE